MASNKRGRPIVLSLDEDVNRRREQARIRRRAFVERRREQAAVGAPPSQAQLQQGETIIEFGFEALDIPPTRPAIGLRVQGLTLPQDSYDPLEQQQSVEVGEHLALYDEDPVDSSVVQPPQAAIPCRPSSIPSQRSPSSSSSGDITRWFRAQPTLPPFREPTVRSPSLPTLHSTMPPPRGIARFFQSLPQQRSSISDSSPSIQSLPSPDSRTDTLAPDTTRLPDTTSYSTSGQSPIDSPRQPSSHPPRSPPPLYSNHLDTLIDSEEDTAIEFTSEMSEQSEPEGDELTDASTPVGLTAERLYRQLQQGFNGCSTADHANTHQRHINASQGHHTALQHLFHDDNFPTVLGNADLLRPEQLRQYDIPHANQWRAKFCGILPDQRHRRRPIQVCIHEEQTQEVVPDVAFDIDSFLGFASSLCIARQGIWYQPAAQMKQNITADVHLESTLFEEDARDNPETPLRSTTIPLRDIPHFLLGRVIGATEITIHILFPHLSTQRIDGKFVALTNQQLTYWLDQIFHPAIYRHVPAHYSQHLTASYRHALSNAKAHQVEGRKVASTSYQSQQSISYHLQPEYLPAIWADILYRVDNTTGLRHFREPQLFFSAKGTKLQFKTSSARPTLLDAIEDFQAYLRRVLDYDFLHFDRFYVDIGKEICPQVALLKDDHAHLDQEPQVYLWRRCCLEHYIRELYDGRPPRPNTAGQRYYTQNMLFDACTLTSVTPKRSPLRSGGLIYSQFYSSVKEVWDATKLMPFDNDGLEELAIDPYILRSIRNSVGGNRRSPEVLRQAYYASKRRAHYTLRDSQQRSFGIREEHRVSWALMSALLRRLQLIPRERLEILLPDCPSYVWPIRTVVYLDFLWRSADKFAAGFEYLYAQSNRDLVTWEQTKMMAMFLRCLRYVLGGQGLSRESALWWSRRENEAGRVWIGLGFCNTLPRYKYAWFEPRINWTQLAFKTEIANHVLFGNSVLKARYLTRGGQVRDFVSLTRQLELGLTWLYPHATDEESVIRDRLLGWIIHLILWQFRIDVLQALDGEEIRPEVRDDALEGLHPFSHAYIESILTEPLYLTSGNRSKFKAPLKLRDELFGLDDGVVRDHWEDRGFRVLYRRARDGLASRHGRDSGVLRMFKRRFTQVFFAYHWILPTPTPHSLHQKTKQSQRMWYSIMVPEEYAVQGDTPSIAWSWGQKDFMVHNELRLPEDLLWSSEQWIDWIGRHRRRGGEGDGDE